MVDPEIMEAFLAESREHLAVVEDRILALERGGDDPSIVNELFRSLHTIKGSSGFVGLGAITELAHALENLVGRLRSGGLEADGSLTDALLGGLDRLRQLIDQKDGDASIEDDLARLASLLPEQPGLRSRRRIADKDQSSAPKPPEESTVRISLPLLDRLMNLATELVLVRNQHVQAVQSGNNENLRAIAQRLNIVTTELQTSIMQTRMRPVGSVFSKFPRIVRDLARKLGKKVSLETTGSDVELDKTIVEAIGDPLTHLVRNAVDHGVEAPKHREHRGKPTRGRLRLSAFHQSGLVNIRLKDDGCGIEPEAIRQVAVDRGMLTTDQAAALADRDAYSLLFAPGFSMADEVTDLSGRGVGLDVVKSSFKRLGGSIEVSSRPGEGTEFTVKLPLTLAIVPALVVAVEDLCFAVPQVNIDEVVWIHGSEVHQKLKRVDDQEVFWLRDRLLPILRLAKVLEIQRSYRSPESGEKVDDRRQDAADRREENDPVYAERRVGPVERRISGANRAFILVMRVGEDRFGLLVDSIVDTEEIVVKSLHDPLKECGAYAGTTVLGDGRIAMILDVAGVAELGNLRFVTREGEETTIRRSRGEARTLLLFDTGGAETYGLPLSLVSRVEEIQPSRIQPANGRYYLEYRGTAMPILKIEDAIGGSPTEYGDDLVSVIIPRGDRPVGLLAARILDTIEVSGEVDLTTLARPGFVGSTLVDGRLVLLLDLFELIVRLEPDWFGGGPGVDSGRVLLVEDSRFFAALISPVFRSQGFTVTYAETGEEALRILREETFDLIVCDVELGTMSGLEVARNVRADPRISDVPLVAISAASDSAVEVDALGAGFDRFESKLDQGRLLDALRSIVAKRIVGGRV